ncbi:DUF3108 domain-containing protein [Pelomonas sp. KK5]|uniref:DUF3108 domain-containing protein n=1 Tax=Pelomonas sp. KK5 TaxID=1855730 RepID=UPI0009FB29D2|nr:DUF3108 domain-containing protein [Pelomonas sp. KK5]
MRSRAACLLPRWIWALGLSLILHAWWLGSWPGSLQLAPARAISTRTMALAAPAPAPAATPANKPRPRQPARAAPPVAALPAEPDLRPAPPAEWLYTLRQNGKAGWARLSWQPAPDGSYRLLLSRELDGRPLPGWRSEGRLDATQGLAPERYATQRGGRDAQATNFRRDEGLISFSASPELHALAGGEQDRLSWCLQLAARVAGAPRRYGPGAELRVTVAGLRGEPVEWVFEVIGEETLDLPALPTTQALHLRRGALGPYDGPIELWLDGSRAWLPVRLSIGPTELLLQAVDVVDQPASPSSQ